MWFIDQVRFGYFKRDEARCLCKDTSGLYFVGNTTSGKLLSFLKVVSMAQSNAWDIGQE